MIAGIVLAAGASRRMGRPKMLLPIGDKTVLGAAVAPLLEADLDRVVVVLGCAAAQVRAGAALAQDSRLSFIVNDAWSHGMSSSLQAGLAACADADAVLVALGDQPGAKGDLVRQLVETWKRGAAPLVLPVYRSRAGHPVLFARPLFAELLALQGDVGAREVVLRHWGEATTIESEPLRDLDTEEDYRRALAEEPARGGEGMPVPKERTSGRL